MSRLRGWCALKAGVRSRGGLVSDSMICFTPTHRYRKRNGRAWSLRSISMPRGILILIYVPRPGDSPPSADAARHIFQRSAPYRGSWSTTPFAGARETWLEECEGHYQDYVCRGRAKRLLGRTWIFPLRRNLTPQHTGPQSTDASIAKQYSSRILIVPACKRR